MRESLAMQYFIATDPRAAFHLLRNEPVEEEPTEEDEEFERLSDPVFALPPPPTPPEIFEQLGMAGGFYEQH